MRSVIAISLATVALAATAPPILAQDNEKPNATEKFLGAEADWPKCRIIATTHSKNSAKTMIALMGNGACTINRVIPIEKVNTKKEIRISANRMRFLRNLLIKHDLLAVKFPIMKGPPPGLYGDTTTINLKNAGGENFYITKEASFGDNPRFDGIAKAVMDLMPTDASPNVTEKFLGAKADWPKCSVTADNIHGLWGGTKVTLKGDGLCTKQQVNTRKKTDTKTEFKTSEESSRALRSLLIKHNLITLKFPPQKGPPLPDASSTKIILKNAAGKIFMIEKWTHEDEPRFDDIAETLMSLTKADAAKSK